VVTKNFGFACTLSVSCIHSKHNFTVEPPRIAQAVPEPIMPSQGNSTPGPEISAELTSDDNDNTNPNPSDQTEKKRQGRPFSITKIEDYEINFQA